MSKLFNTSRRLIIMSAVVILLLPALTFVIINVVVGAPKQSEMLIMTRAPMSPVIFRDIKTKDDNSNDVDVTFGQEFIAGDEWLKHLSFTVRSTAPKPIVYVELELVFRDTEKSERPMVHLIRLGRKPGSKLATTNQPMVLKVGQSANVELEKDFAELVKFMSYKNSEPKAFGQAELAVGMVVFNDNTAWKAGMFYIQDQNDPSRYVPTGTLPNSGNAKR